MGPGRVKGQEVEETKQPIRKPELGPGRVKGQEVEGTKQTDKQTKP